MTSKTDARQVVSTMGDIKLFSIQAGVAKELVGSFADMEKHVQQLIETNMETLLGVRFPASE